ncbi:ryncolin-2-like [Saccostrea echinata]|uniref:ryncolin-2-like n=1 Tax=Saccostrea echinata TaxID=191078 RepID=UPI002A83D5C4|nr:ryncolin-2-like [Saccostrea echinata]
MRKDTNDWSKKRLLSLRVNLEGHLRFGKPVIRPATTRLSSSKEASHIAVGGDCLNHSCNNGSICIHGECVQVLRENCFELLRDDSNLQGKDGVYQIYVAPEVKAVYCDMSTDGGGWTAIQRRQDNSTDFFRTWIEYKEGFGNPTKNYWIGNNAIHTLTKDGSQELRIELQRFNGEKAFAQYSTFSLGSEDTYFKLLCLGIPEQQVNIFIPIKVH